MVSKARLERARLASSKRYDTCSVQIYITGEWLLWLAAKQMLPEVELTVLYHDLFWRTLRFVPLRGFLSNIHIMTVVAALKLNQVKMYYQLC
jgi:hypothetical protein